MASSQKVKIFHEADTPPHIQPKIAWLNADKMEKPGLELAETTGTIHDKLNKLFDETAATSSSLPTAAENSLWASFCRKTTFHGLSQIADKEESRFTKIIYGLFIAILTIGLLVSIYVITYDKLVLKGLQREFLVQHNETMFLPDIHICDTSLFNRSILEQMGINKTLASYFALSLSPVLASQRLKESDANLLEELDKDFIRLTQEKNESIQGFFEKAVLKCEDIVLSCNHGRQKYGSVECCKTIFGGRRHLSHFASMCVSTRGQSRLLEELPSQIYGLVVYLKTDVENSFEFDPMIITSNIASRRGLLFALSDPSTDVNPAILSNGYYTQTGTWTGIAIKLTQTDNTALRSGLLSPYGCSWPDSKENLHLIPDYDTYSRENCRFSSKRILVENQLNCSIFHFVNERKESNANHKAFCHPKQMINTYSSDLVSKIRSKLNGCPEDCVIEEYSVSTSTTKLNLHDDDETHDGEDHDKLVTHTALHFFYPSFSVSILKNHPESIIRWISEVGGNMSLFVGASAITLLEFIVLIYRCLTHQRN